MRKVWSSLVTRSVSRAFSTFCPANSTEPKPSHTARDWNTTESRFEWPFLAVISARQVHLRIWQENFFGRKIMAQTGLEESSCPKNLPAKTPSSHATSPRPKPSHTIMPVSAAFLPLRCSTLAILPVLSSPRPLACRPAAGTHRSAPAIRQSLRRACHCRLRCQQSRTRRQIHIRARQRHLHRQRRG